MDPFSPCRQFNPFANEYFHLLLCQQTDKQQTSVCTMSKLLKRLRKNAWVSIFRLKQQYIDIYMYMCQYMYISTVQCNPRRNKLCMSRGEGRLGKHTFLADTDEHHTKRINLARFNKDAPAA
jgi:hypothetical protein